MVKRGQRIAMVLAAVAIVGLVGAGPADAHDPLFLTAEQTSPDTGPFLPDGTISFAIYGDVSGSGDTRGFEVRFDEGDRLLLELLVPDQEPEASLREVDLPRATVTAPDATVTVLRPDRRESFFEPFSSTQYLRIAGLDGTASAGVYGVVIEGDAPARFTVAVGTIETFLTPVERVVDRPESFADIAAQLSRWYSTPPGALADETAADSAAGDVAPADEPEPTTAEEPAAAATGQRESPTATEEPARRSTPTSEPAEATDAAAAPASSPSGGAGSDAPLLIALVVAGVVVAGGISVVVRRRTTTSDG